MMLFYYRHATYRTVRHSLIAFGILIFPVVSLLIFSLVTKMQFFDALYDLLISMWRLFAAFIIATTVGWLMVVLLIRGKTEAPTLAIFDVLQSLPTFIILPIGIHYFGQSELIIILFLAITIIWAIVFSIVNSLQQIDRSWSDAVKVSGISGLTYVRYFLLPATTPGIVTGAIIGLGDGWQALIATELLLHTETGLGPFFGSFSDNTTMTFFGVLIFLSLIFALNKFIWLPLLDKSHKLVAQ